MPGRSLTVEEEKLVVAALMALHRMVSHGQLNTKPIATHFHLAYVPCASESFTWLCFARCCNHRPEQLIIMSFLRAMC